MLQQIKINKIKTILFWLLMIILFLIIYNMGTSYGMFVGANSVLVYKNDTLCNFMHDMNENTTVYYENDGYCVFNDTYKFNVKLDCSFIKIEYIGKRNMTWYENSMLITNKIMYYPIMRCW